MPKGLFGFRGKSSSKTTPDEKALKFGTENSLTPVVKTLLPTVTRSEVSSTTRTTVFPEIPALKSDVPSRSKEFSSVPNEIVCPLSLDVMVDPVRISSGHTYEKAYIKRWFELGHKTCPKTKKDVNPEDLNPNEEVRRAVQEWVARSHLKLPEKVDVKEELLTVVKPPEKTLNFPSHGMKHEFREQRFQNFRDEMPRTFSSKEMVEGRIRSGPLDNRPFSESDISLVAAGSIAVSKTDTVLKYDRKKYLAGGRRPSGSKQAAEVPIPEESEVVCAIEKAKTGEGGAVLEAALSLRNLTRTGRETRLQMHRSGAVSVLISLMAHSDPLVVENAITATLNLGLDPELKVPIATAGALPPLVQLAIHAETEASRENAIGAICNLSAAEGNRERIWELGVVPLLVSVVKESQRGRVRKDALIGLFNLSLEERVREELLDMEVAEASLEFLEGRDKEIEEEVSLLLYSLTKTPRGCEKVLEAEGVAVLASLIDDAGSGTSGTGSSGESTQANVVGCLLQLATTLREGLEAVREEITISTLVRVLETGTPRAKDKAASLVKLLKS